MMKRFALGLLFSLWSSLAIAQGCGPQNPNCIVPTAPAGTNNNQAASAAFVQQNALTTAALSVPFTQQFTVSSNIPTIANFGFNPIGIGLIATDSASCTCPTPGQNIPTLMTIEERFGGSNINNGRNAIAANLQMTSATSPTNPFRFYVAANFLSNMQNGDGGSAGTPNGAIEAVTGLTYLQGTSTNVRNMTAAEFSISANAGSSVAQKAILTLDTFVTDSAHGVTNGAVTGVDTYIWSFATGTSYNTWAQIDMTGGVAPVATTGTFIKILGSYTTTNGIDFGSTVQSGNTLQWGGGSWFLAGNGNATLNNVTAANITGAWSASGFTPAPQCGTATFTVNSGRFKTMGKTTFLQLDTTITAIGNCVANSITFTAPNSAASTGSLAFLNARSTAVGICFISAAGSTFTCQQQAGPAFVVNDHLLIEGIYENL
jgi:hypothetical protein